LASSFTVFHYFISAKADLQERICPKEEKDRCGAFAPQRPLYWVYSSGTTV
jgi:hypothetical protein